MGRGDNRKTPKTRQRKAWRRKKARLAAVMAGRKGVGPKAAPKPAGSTVVKKKAAPKAE